MGNKKSMAIPENSRKHYGHETDSPPLLLKAASHVSAAIVSETKVTEPSHKLTFTPPV